MAGFRFFELRLVALQHLADQGPGLFPNAPHAGGAGFRLSERYHDPFQHRLGGKLDGLPGVLQPLENQPAGMWEHKTILRVNLLHLCCDGRLVRCLRFPDGPIRHNG